MNFISLLPGKNPLNSSFSTAILTSSFWAWLALVAFPPGFTTTTHGTTTVLWLWRPWTLSSPCLGALAVLLRLLCPVPSQGSLHCPSKRKERNDAGREPPASS